MAKMAKRKKTVIFGRQAPAGAWSPHVLLAALSRDSGHKDKLEVLKKAGILDKNGNLTKTYKNWGSKVTRTPVLKTC